MIQSVSRRLGSSSRLSAVSRLSTASRARLPASFTLQTRVQDTDLQGHINNVKYYEFMDTAICTYSAENGDNLEDNWRFIAETGLKYRRPARYPDPVEVRFGTKFVGNSSVEYEVGMYNTSGELLADGKFVHVYVSTEGRPHRIPDMSRKLLDSISVLPDETL